MSHLKSSLPTAKDTEMSVTVTREANAAVPRVLTPTKQSTSHKQKVYSAFSDEQRATIGQYTGNAAAVKKFKGDFDNGLGESTVRLFKKRYLAELKKVMKENVHGEVPHVVTLFCLETLIKTFKLTSKLKLFGKLALLSVLLAGAEGII